MSDEIIWQAINQNFCSHRVKTKHGNFCRNEYNVTGLCNRQSCPLANSRYATVRSDPDTGAIYLYIKTPERAHMPAKWWEKIKLPTNYAAALQEIDARLIYWPKFLVHKCKQRLTRLTQVAIRMKKLAKEEERLGERLVPKLAPKIKRREETRERKAEAAAKVERAIERELIERLRSGAYGDKPLNVDENIWNKVLHGLEAQGEGERDLDEDEDEDEEEEEEEMEADVEYVSDVEDEEDDMEDFEDWLSEEGEEESGEESSEEEEDSEEESDSESDDDEDDDKKKKPAPATAGKRKRTAAVPRPRKRGGHVEIEYEHEAPVRDNVYA